MKKDGLTRVATANIVTRIRMRRLRRLRCGRSTSRTTSDIGVKFVPLGRVNIGSGAKFASDVIVTNDMISRDTIAIHNIEDKIT